MLKTDPSLHFPAAGQAEGRVLVVDLDGTLLKSDLLYECLWSSLSRSPLGTARALASSGGKRSRIKACLGSAADLPVETLPYREEVLDHVRQRRDAGDLIVLATAATQTLADRIAAHLGLFDEVFGSSETHNLKGPRKAEFLAERYGSGGFDYIGDSRADLAVWREADRALVVGDERRFRKGLAGREGEVSHLGGPESTLRAAIKALRPHQWSKNLLVLLPIVAAHEYSPAVWMNGALAFIAFCLVASGIYLLNDLLDLASDRAHPNKRFRPLAAGRLPLAYGSVLFPALVASGLSIAAWLGPGTLLVTLGYVALTTGYSFYFKGKIVLDICVLAGLYTTRIIAGSAATDLPTSVWLLGFSIFLFFGLAAVKRLAEISIKAKGQDGALSGRAYEAQDSDIIAAMAVASSYAAILIFALYLNTPTVTELYATPQALWLVCPLLLYWTSRTIILAHRGLVEDDPIVFSFRDKVSRICFVLVALILVTGGVADLGGVLDEAYAIS